PIFPDSSSESGASSPIFDIDLGAFELVDSGMSAEALLSHDDPVIFHKDMPVHSVHHDTVETEMALASLMNAPSSMMSTVVPPAMVADNYCFIVDGDKIKMGDIMGDDQWWRHTSRPTKFFYSEDLKRFYRVNCITAKGKIISAKLASATPAPGGAIGPHLAVPQSSGSYPGTAAPSALQSYAATPRSSMSFQTRNSRGVEVPLENVYKVIRFYSFWRTCTSFHRIVTMIDKVRPDERFDNAIFGRRLFVQYLWRNAKASEKARVQKEFDPRRQRLLKFVTDPATRKKMTGADRPGTSRFKSTS
ncbi:CRE-TWK-2 protein, partial [Aphelenchoides avenae]